MHAFTSMPIAHIEYCYVSDTEAAVRSSARSLSIWRCQATSEHATTEKYLSEIWTVRFHGDHSKFYNLTLHFTFTPTAPHSKFHNLPLHFTFIRCHRWSKPFSAMDLELRPCDDVDCRSCAPAFVTGRVSLARRYQRLLTSAKGTRPPYWRFKRLMERSTPSRF